MMACSAASIIRKRASPTSPGVRIVELLVSLAVLSVLLAIALPALRAVRATAQDGASLANIQSSARDLLTEANADGDRLPIATRPSNLRFGRQPGVGLSMPDGSELMFSWFAHVNAWPFVLVSRHGELHESWYSPSNLDREPGALMSSDYILTQAAMADPSYWRRDAEQTPELLRPVRVGEFEHPSQKGLLVERTQTVLARRPGKNEALVARPIAFVDGHAQRRAIADARPGVPNSLQGGFTRPIATTERGCLGYDY